MAELINEIISPEAFKQVADMKSELASLTKQMEDMLKAMGKAPAVGGGNAVKNTTDAIQAQSEQMKQLQIVKNKIITTEAKLNDEYVQQAARLKELNSELRANVAQTGLAEGSLDQMRANLNKLEKLYSAMSAEMRNAKVGQTIFADMVKAKEGVTLLEQSMGNYKRNVGNYQNSTFQLTQTLRELPAFAYSAQTGLLGISNNLPMLADGFQKVAQATNESTGKVNGFFGALKIFGKSLFSFTNLFGLAVTAVTLFAPAIAEAATSMRSTGSEADKAKDKVQGFVDALNAPEVKDAISGVEMLKNELFLLGKGLTTQKDVLDKYNKTFGESVGYAKNFEEAESRILKQGDKIIELTIKKAVAAKYLNDITQKQIALNAIGTDPSFFDEMKAAYTKSFASGRTMGTSLIIDFIDNMTKTKSEREKDLQMYYKGMRGILNKELGDTKELYKKANEEVAIMQKETGLFGGKPEKEGKDKPDKPNEPYKPEFKINNNDYDDIKKYFSDLEKAFEDAWKEQKPFFEQRILQDIEDSMTLTIAPTLPDDQANALNAQLLTQAKNRQAKTEADKKALDDYQKKLEQVGEAIRKVTEGINAIGDLASSFIDRKLQEIDMQQKRMEEYYDAEKMAIDQLSISQEEKTKRITALEAQRAAQQKRIDAERLQAERKQAAIQKGINIANIIGATALAIITQYTALPVATQIPRSIVAGAIGATQLAAAIAAPLPQFAKGTDNAPEGFAVVGERGTELVVNPDGTSWLTPAKDTITYLKKGAKVVPNNELMDMVKYANYVNVGGIKQGETGGLFGMALVAEFQQLSEKVDGLTRIMAGKNMSVNIQGNYDHYLHVRKNIR